jgi:phosphate transport system substrate-binding protein
MSILVFGFIVLNPSLGLSSDGIAVVIHKDVPIGSLDSKMIRDIYSIEALSWKTIRGPDIPFVPIEVEAPKGMNETFRDFFKIKAALPKNGIRVANENAVLQAILKDPKSIGFVRVSEFEGSPEKEFKKKLKLLRIDNQKPTIQAIKKGEYKLTWEAQKSDLSGVEAASQKTSVDDKTGSSKGLKKEK